MAGRAARANDAVGAGRQVGQADPQGRRGEGLLPVPHEKTPSFTVSDDKGFYHCFGCGAHGDAIRWLTDSQGLAFMDAVKELAALAGMDVPAPIAPGAAARTQVASASDVLHQAARWYAQQLQADDKVKAALAERGITPASIDKFGLGFAPPKKGVAGCGAPTEALAAAGCWSPTNAAAPGATSSATG
jgi:DNA primase